MRKQRFTRISTGRRPAPRASRSLTRCAPGTSIRRHTPACRPTRAASSARSSPFAAVLADEIKRAQAEGDPDSGATYYRHWLAALERLVAAKGVTDAASLARYRDAWDHAADRTPHGMPILLQPEDFKS